MKSIVRKILLIIVLTSGLGTTSNAQSQISGWGAYISNFQFKQSNWGLQFDAQLRSSDGYQRLQQYLIRPAVSYKFNKTLTASAGYAYVSNYAIVEGLPDRVDEHRAYEQLILNHKISKVALTHRFRNEHRWISSAAEPDTYDNQQRFRYFLRGIVPLKVDSVFTKGFFGAFQNEIMFNYVNKETTNNHFFDQNRAYAALGYRINPKIDIEAGYMNQLVQQRSGSTFTNNIFQLAIYSRLNL